MKIAVLNFSGNVGKTTIAKHLLQRKMNCEVFSVESINASNLEGSAVTQITHKQFSDLQTALLLNDDLIVDIGSSNVENLLKEISNYSGSQDDFDFFVIPTVPKDKQILDSISTIVYLIDELNIPKEKIRVVYNFAESADTIDHDFEKIERVLSTLKIKDASSFVLETDYFSKVDAIRDSNYSEELKQKVSDLDFMASNQELIQNDLKSLKEKFKSANPEEKLSIKEEMLQLAQIVQLSRLSIGVRDNIDGAFTALFPTKKRK